MILIQQYFRINLHNYHTVSVPEDRENPQERVQQVLERDEGCFSKWYEQDSIFNFESFKSDLQKMTVYPFSVTVKDVYQASIKLKDESFSDIPSVSI